MVEDTLYEEIYDGDLCACGSCSCPQMPVAFYQCNRRLALVCLLSIENLL